MKNVQGSTRMGFTRMGFTRNGFTLFELLIALMCTVLAFSALMSLSMRLYQSWHSAAAVTQSSCEMQAAIDVVRNDLQRAPRARSAWQQLGPHELAWRSGDKVLRIALVKNRLERREGSSSSVLAHGVAQVRFTDYHRTSETCDAFGVMLVMADGKEGAWLLSVG